MNPRLLFFRRVQKTPPGHGGTWCHGCLWSFLCRWPRLCPTSQPLDTAGHSREIPSKSLLEDSFFSKKSLKCPLDQGLKSQQMNLSLKLLEGSFRWLQEQFGVGERDFCPTLFCLVARAFKIGQKSLWSWIPVGLTQSQLFCLEIPSLEPLGKINVCINPG